MRLFYLTLVLTLIAAHSFANEITIKTNPIKLEKYDCTQANVIYLPTDFARPFIISKKDLTQLESNKIHHVDLVYTAYKEAADFDQIGLNERRLEELKKLLPQINSDKPVISQYEQTGATIRSDAKAMFHGFVIHYGKDLTWQSKSEFFTSIQVPFSTIKINNETGGRVEYYTGSSIEIEPLAVVNKDGASIEGDYELYYREFRTQAEFIMSGLPMTLDENGIEKQFNSVGMYEIRAKKNGEEVFLKDDVIVNFQTTEILPDVSFFKMSEDGHWDAEFELDYDETDITFEEGSKYTLYSNEMLGKQVKLSKFRPAFKFGDVTFEGYSRIADKTKIDERQFYAILSSQSWRVFKALYDDKSSPLVDWVSDVNSEIKGMLLSREKSVDFIEMVLEFPIESIDKTDNEDGSTSYSVGDIGEKAGLRNLLGDENIPPSPGLIRGLQSRGFGVFNCDQTRRIVEPLALSPTYFDEETGKQLEELYVASIVDLDMNAAFSFHPNHLVVNGNLNAKLVLFTRSKEIYIFDQSDFAKINTNENNVAMQLKNITGEVKNTRDLQKILNL